VSLRTILTDYRNSDSMAFKARRRRAEILKQTLQQCAPNGQGVRIVDFGGTEDFWASVGYDYLRDNGIHITLVNTRPQTLRQTDLFSAIQADVRQFIPSQRYDLCFSNSCIEHVGGTRDQMQFRDAVLRAAPSYFIQTPSFWFPLEPHFLTVGFHWLPRWAQTALIRRVQLGHMRRGRDLLDSRIIAESCTLLSAQTLQALFPDAHIHREKVFGLTKSLIAIKTASGP